MEEILIQVAGKTGLEWLLRMCTRTVHLVLLHRLHFVQVCSERAGCVVGGGG